jgi:hypothetical protein
MRSVSCFILLLAFGLSLAHGVTYYVASGGDDSGPGTSSQHPWRSCDKVNRTRLAPGDAILFHRGQQWRESLVPSSDGLADAPITFGAYGDGAKPRFLGSETLDNAGFILLGDNRYSITVAERADSVLADHQFISSRYENGQLIIISKTDPRSDRKVYSACVRGNVIFSNRKNHLVFRDLIVDETAARLNDGAVQGYGIRIEGSTDVLLDGCEAYRCGRHHIAVINSNGFVGRHLRAGYVVPNMPGGCTAFVAYADAAAPSPACTSDWDDIAADALDDGAEHSCVSFASHGDHLGRITVNNSTFLTKVSFMSAPVVVYHCTLKGDASIENWGSGALIDGCTLLGSSAIDQWAGDGTIQNCIARLTPAGAGPTGFSAAIVIRDKARNNCVRFNTLLTRRFSCVALAGENSATQWYGNIMLADGATLTKSSSAPTAIDVQNVDWNFYSPTATFAGKKLQAWQALGFDPQSRAGDPKINDDINGNLDLKPGSPCANGAAVNHDRIPPFDFTGRKRPSSRPSIGAFEPAG